MTHSAPPPTHTGPLPLRHGVSASVVVLPTSRQPLPWPTLLDALAARLPTISRTTWQQRMANGLVVNADGQPLAADSPCHSGQRVHYWREVVSEVPIPFEHTVLFQDEHLVVTDKPHFLPVTPGGPHVAETLLARLRVQLGLPDLTPLHRIDRETAGLVAFAVRPQDRDAYHRLFRERQVHKVYEAVAPWRADLALPLVHSSHLREDPERFFLTQEVPATEAQHLGLAPNSTTHIHLLARHGEHALYQLHPISGRRHQLRVHMAALGVPILNDLFYPDVRSTPSQGQDFSQPALQLLARSLAFTDPVTAQQRVFQSGLQLAAICPPTT